MKINAQLRRKESEIEYYQTEVEYVKLLSDREFTDFSESLLFDKNFMADNVELMYTDKNDYKHCILLINEEDGDGILVDSSGSNYARYSAFLPKIKSAIDQDAQENSMTKVSLYEKSAIIEECQKEYSFQLYEEYPYREYPFNIEKVETAEDLHKVLCINDYAIRTGFIYEDLAFVQQSHSGDEWLTMKKDENEYKRFESISFEAIFKRGGEDAFYEELDRCLSHKLEQSQEMNMC